MENDLSDREQVILNDVEALVKVAQVNGRRGCEFMTVKRRAE